MITGAKIFSIVILSALLTSCGGKPSHPVESAVFRNNIEELQQLIDAGFNVAEKINDRGQTALHVACHHGKPDAVKILIEVGADVRATDSRGRTPWATIVEKSSSQKSAFRQDESEVLIQLLKAGFEPDSVRGVGGRTIIHQLAERCERTGVLSTAVKTLKLSVDVRDDNGWTPLHVAASAGRWGACEDLLDAGANVNAETQSMVKETTTKGFSTTTDRVRYESGSRPLDLVSDHGTRSRSGVGDLLKNRGGTRNSAVNNDVYK